MSGGAGGGHHPSHLADAPEQHWSEEHDLPVEGAWQEPGAGHAAYHGEPQEAHYTGPWAAEPEEAPLFDGAPLPSRRSTRVSKRVRRRRRTVVFFIVLALFAVVVFFVVQTVRPLLGGFQAADYPGPGTGGVQVVVPEGSTARSVASELRTQDVVASEQSFLDALDAAHGAGSLQPGSFQMRKQMKASDAVSVLLSKDAAKVHYAAVAQNLRIGETLAVLATSTGIPKAEFEQLANDPKAFGLPAQAKNLEGYLSPGEYRFPVELGAKAILAQMVDATKARLVKAGITDPAAQYRTLIIASIIEFEGNEANYAKISGAIENRINNPNGETGGRLESDATVAYGLGIKTYNITDAQKADKKNLYNTFANPGLPVGPIGSPAGAAIEAAAHPEANPYYFWVTVNLKTGETLYATTFAEHLKNVAKYTAWCGANPGECK
ncbi:endolytic transglycosylase MltG [Arthrobacter wenxiniae]|uniref:Endolytic murein transglycosylase n=1 Tax=Arthrobacter wenxiniae TaxID=2713570 RepID=A0A7Y7IG48_9MICC|nr:endolytic transglycosylase MltG [Arthrobacter wenxiniae]NVM94587.1 endolytic transglycosylase MltG [Arthrobacter wenxiniae]